MTKFSEKSGIGQAEFLFFALSERLKLNYEKGRKLQGLLAENALAIKYFEQKSLVT